MKIWQTSQFKRDIKAIREKRIEDTRRKNLLNSVFSDKNLNIKVYVPPQLNRSNEAWASRYQGLADYYRQRGNNLLVQPKPTSTVPVRTPDVSRATTLSMVQPAKPQDNRIMIARPSQPVVSKSEPPPPEKDYTFGVDSGLQVGQRVYLDLDSETPKLTNRFTPYTLFNYQGTYVVGYTDTDGKLKLLGDFSDKIETDKLQSVFYTPDLGAIINNTVPPYDPLRRFELDTNVKSNSRLYYDIISNRITSSPTQIPLYVNKNGELNISEGEPLFYDEQTSKLIQNMVQSVEAQTGAVETLQQYNVPKSPWEVQTPPPEVAPEDLTRIFSPSYLYRVSEENRQTVALGDEKNPDMLMVREKTEVDLPFGFSQWDEKSFGGKAVQSILGTIFTFFVEAGQIPKQFAFSGRGNQDKKPSQFGTFIVGLPTLTLQGLWAGATSIFYYPAKWIWGESADEYYQKVMTEYKNNLNAFSRQMQLIREDNYNSQHLSVTQRLYELENTNLDDVRNFSERVPRELVEYNLQQEKEQLQKRYDEMQKVIEQSNGYFARAEIYNSNGWTAESIDSKTEGYVNLFTLGLDWEAIYAVTLDPNKKDHPLQPGVEYLTEDIELLDPKELEVLRTFLQNGTISFWKMDKSDYDRLKETMGESFLYFTNPAYGEAKVRSDFDNLNYLFMRDLSVRELREKRQLSLSEIYDYFTNVWLPTISDRIQTGYTVENIARQRAIQRRNKAYTLWNLGVAYQTLEGLGEEQAAFPQGLPLNKSKEFFQLAQELLIDTYPFDRRIAVVDPYAAPSFEFYPERREQFYQDLAKAELQLNKPLSRQQIIDISQRHIDLAVEMTTEMILDISNLIPMGGVAKKILGGVFGIAGDVLLRSKFGKALGIPAGYARLQTISKAITNSTIIKAITTRSSYSISLKRQQKAANLMSDIMRIRPASKKEFLERVEQVATFVKQLNNVQSQEEMAQLLDTLRVNNKIPRGISNRVLFEEATDLAKVIDPDKWVSIAEDVYMEGLEQASRKAKEIVEASSKQSNLLGKFFDIEDAEIIQNKIAYETDKIMRSRTTGRSISVNFADRFRNASLDSFRAWEGTNILEDTFSGILGRRYANLRPVLDLAHRVNRMFMNAWVWATLARRPSWVIYNFIDNTFRYFMSGSFAWNDISTIWKTFLTSNAGEKVLNEIGVPADVAIEFTRPALSVTGEDVVKIVGAKTAMNLPDNPLGWFSHYRSAFAEVTKNAGFFGKVWGAFKAFPASIISLNESIEFGVRTRLYYNLYLRNVAKVNHKFLGQVLEMMSERLLANGLEPSQVDRYLKYLKQAWEMAGNDPEKLARLMDFSIRAGTKSSHNLSVPENLLQAEWFDADAKNLFLSGVQSQLDNFINDLVDDGVTELTEDHVNLFFDRIVKVLDLEIAARLDTEFFQTLKIIEASNAGDAFRNTRVPRFDHSGGIEAVSSETRKTVEDLANQKIFTNRQRKELRKVLRENGIYFEANDDKSLLEGLNILREKIRNIDANRPRPLTDEQVSTIEKTIDTNSATSPKNFEEHQAYEQILSKNLPPNELRTQAGQELATSRKSLKDFIYNDLSTDRSYSHLEKEQVGLLINQIEYLQQQVDNFASALHTFFLHVYPAPKLLDEAGKLARPNQSTAVLWDKWFAKIAVRDRNRALFFNTVLEELKAGTFDFSRKITPADVLAMSGVEVVLDSTNNIQALRIFDVLDNKWVTIDNPFALKKFSDYTGVRNAYQLYSEIPMKDISNAGFKELQYSIVSQIIPKSVGTYDELVEKSAKLKLAIAENRWSDANLELAAQFKFPTLAFKKSTNEFVPNNRKLFYFIKKHLSPEVFDENWKTLNDISPSLTYQVLSEWWSINTAFELKVMKENFERDMVKMFQAQYAMSAGEARAVFDLYNHIMERIVKSYTNESGTKLTATEMWMEVIQGFYSEGTPGVGHLVRGADGVVHFQSSLDTFIRYKLKNNLTGSEILEQLSKKKFSDVELEWLGVKDWLTERSSVAVDRNELLKFIETNQRWVHADIGKNGEWLVYIRNANGEQIAKVKGNLFLDEAGEEGFTRFNAVVVEGTLDETSQKRLLRWISDNDFDVLELGDEQIKIPDEWKNLPKPNRPKINGTFGSTAFLKDANDKTVRIIRAFQGSNVTTSIHEIFHAIEPFLPEADRQALELYTASALQKMRSQNIKWIENLPDEVAKREIVARTWEKYLAINVAPNEKIQTIFNKLRNYLVEIYKSIKGYFDGISVTDEVRRTFDRILDVDDLEKNVKNNPQPPKTPTPKQPKKVVAPPKIKAEIEVPKDKPTRKVRKAKTAEVEPPKVEIPAEPVVEPPKIETPVEPVVEPPKAEPKLVVDLERIGNSYYFIYRGDLYSSPLDFTLSIEGIPLQAKFEAPENSAIERLNFLREETRRAENVTISEVQKFPEVQKIPEVSKAATSFQDFIKNRKPITKEYFISTNEGYEPAKKAFGVKLDKYPDLDLFVTKLERDIYALSEGITGLRITSFNASSKKRVLEIVESEFEKRVNELGGIDYVYKAITTLLNDPNKVPSPRWADIAVGLGEYKVGDDVWVWTKVTDMFYPNNNAYLKGKIVSIENDYNISVFIPRQERPFLDSPALPYYEPQTVIVAKDEILQYNNYKEPKQEVVLSKPDSMSSLVSSLSKEERQRVIDELNKAIEHFKSQIKPVDTQKLYEEINNSISERVVFNQEENVIYIKWQKNSVPIYLTENGRIRYNVKEFDSLSFSTQKAIKQAFIKVAGELEPYKIKIGDLELTLSLPSQPYYWLNVFNQKLPEGVYKKGEVFYQLIENADNSKSVFTNDLSDDMRLFLKGSKFIDDSGNPIVFYDNPSVSDFLPIGDNGAYIFSSVKNKFEPDYHNKIYFLNGKNIADFRNFDASDAELMKVVDEASALAKVDRDVYLSAFDGTRLLNKNELYSLIEVTQKNNFDGLMLHQSVDGYQSVTSAIFDPSKIKEILQVDPDHSAEVLFSNIKQDFVDYISNFAEDEDVTIRNLGTAWLGINGELYYVRDTHGDFAKDMYAGFYGRNINTKFNYNYYETLKNYMNDTHQVRVIYSHYPNTQTSEVSLEFYYPLTSAQIDALESQIFLDGNKVNLHVDFSSSKKFFYNEYQVTPDNFREIMRSVNNRLRNEMTGNERVFYQRVLPETPEFRKWFEGSKIVDENNEPLIVYHGTSSVFSAFDIAMIGSATDAGWFGHGFYFTPNPYYASTYAESIVKGNIMPVYLSIKNPFRFRSDKIPAEIPTEWWVTGSKYQPSVANYGSLRFREKLIELGYDGVIVEDYVIRKEDGITGELAEKIKNELKKRNKEDQFDSLNQVVMEGITYDEIYMYFGHEITDLLPNKLETVEIVAFYPNQIKSIFNPRPTDKPEILFQKAIYPETPEFKQWFRDSKIVDENGMPLRLYHGTFSDFQIFELQKSTPENFYGRGFYFTSNPSDASGNYANVLGADVNHRIEKRAEEIFNEWIDNQLDDLFYSMFSKDVKNVNEIPESVLMNKATEIAKKEIFSGNQGLIMPVYLRMENPAYLTRDSLASKFSLPPEAINNEDLYDSAVEEIVNKIYDLLGRNLETDNNIFSFGDDISFTDVWDAIFPSIVEDLQNNGEVLLLDISKYLKSADVYNNTFVNMLQDLGYDGIVMNATETFTWMKKGTKNTYHYIVWKPEQIKSVFNPKPTENPNILMQRIRQANNKIPNFRNFDEWKYYNLLYLDNLDYLMLDKTTGLFNKQAFLDFIKLPKYKNSTFKSFSLHEYQYLVDRFSPEESNRYLRSVATAIQNQLDNSSDVFYFGNGKFFVRIDDQNESANIIQQLQDAVENLNISLKDLDGKEWKVSPILQFGDLSFDEFIRNDLPLSAEILDEIYRRVLRQGYFINKEEFLANYQTFLKNNNLDSLFYYNLKPANEISLMEEILQGQKHKPYYVLLQDIATDPEVELDEAWRAFVQNPIFEHGDRKVSPKDLWGLFFENEEMLYLAGAEGFAKFAKSTADRLLAEGLEEQASVFEMLAGYVRSFGEEISHNVIKLDKLVPPSFPIWRVDENIRKWVTKTYGLSEQWFQARKGMDFWRNDFIEKLGDDTVLADLDRTPELSKTLTEIGVEASKVKSEMNDLVNYGGKLDDIDIKGAISETNRILIDYSDTNRFDQFIKGFFPFWTYPSKSIPYWLNLLVSHPELISFYEKYKRFSRANAVQNGALTSRGDVLPSLRNYLPIGGGLWFNPLAPLFYRYAYPRIEFTPETRPEDEMTPLQYVAKFFLDDAPMFGFAINPVTTAVLQTFYEPYYPKTSLAYEATRTVIPLEYIPPFFERWILEKVRKVSGVPMPELLAPQVSWKDFLIERHILSNALLEIQLAETDIEKERIAKETVQIIQNPERENDPRWITAREEIEQKEYYRRLGGMLSGVYTKEFTMGQAELVALNEEVNLLKASIENETLAGLFKQSSDPLERYDKYINRRYETPDGWIANMYQTVRFVTDPETLEILKGQERRDEIARQVLEDEQTNLYYEAIKEATQRKNDRLADLPVGAWQARKEIINQFNAEIEQIKNSPLYEMARKETSLGYKPPEKYKDNFETQMWINLTLYRPERDNYSTWKEYEEALQEWENSIPELARLYMPTLELSMRYQIVKSGVNVEKRLSQLPTMINELLEKANVQGYSDWIIRNDTGIDAIWNAYQELYLKPYYDAVKDKSGWERDLAELQFLKSHTGEPTPQQIYAWIKEKYGNKFTEKEILAAIKGLDFARPDEISDFGKSDFEKSSDEVWEILSWAGNRSGETYKALEKAYLQLGGNKSDIDIFYAVGGDPNAYSDPKQYTEFLSRLKMAAEKINLQKPDEEQLIEFVESKKLNEQFKSVVEAQLGESFYDILREYSVLDDAEKKQWRKENRDYYLLIQRYYDMKDRYAEMYPLWMKYYHSDYKSKSTGGTYSGTYRNTYSRGTYTGKAPSGRVSIRPSSSFLKMGKRSSLDSMELLAPLQLGRGGITSAPFWDYELTKKLSPKVIEEINNKNLTKAGETYLKKVASKNPEYRFAIRKAIQYAKGFTMYNPTKTPTRPQNYFQ